MAQNAKVNVQVTAEGAQAAAQDVQKTSASVIELNQAVELAKNAYNALAGAVGELMDLYAVQEQAEARVAAVIKSTGGAAGQTLEGLKAMASGLQEVTTFGDEATLQGQAMLLTFTNIGEETFPNATKTMLDMAAAMGGDLKGTAIQLGKALNDPVNGISALTRVGVTFTEAQKAQIKAMSDAGDVAGAQALILAELNKEFGGMSEAIAQTTSGQMQQMTNQIGDMKEQLGELVFKALQPFFGIIRAGVAGLQVFVEWLRPLHPILAPLVGVVGALTAALVAYSTVTSLTTVKTIALTVAQNAKKIAEVAGAAVTWAATAAQWALNAAMTANPIGLIIVGIGALIAVIVGLAAWIIDLVGGWDSVNKVMAKVWEFLKQGLVLFLKFGNPIGLMITALTYLYEKFEFVRVVIDSVWESIKAVGAAIAEAASWIGDVLGLSGDEQVEAVEKAEAKKQEVVEKSYEEQAKEIETGMKKQLQILELQEARGVINKEKATTLKLELERKYWADMKALAEKNGQDASEFELKQAQAEQQLREEAAERAKKARERRNKEEQQYEKLRVDNITDATEKAWAQYDLDVANADKALRAKEISQRVHEQTMTALVRKLKTELQKIEKEGAEKSKEALKADLEEEQMWREYYADEEMQRRAEQDRQRSAADAARQIGAEMAPSDLARIDAKYQYERDALEESLRSGEMLTEEYNARRAQLDRQYSDDKKAYALESSKAMFDGMAKLLGEDTAAGKAAALASATISTYTAAAKALEVGPIFGPILAAIITAQGLAQVAKIAGTKVPGRRAGGPVTSGFYQVGEEGEEFVMNAGATARNRTLLEAMNAGAAPGREFVPAQAPAPALSRSVVDLNGKFILDGRTAYVLVEQEVAIQRGNTL